MSRPTESVVFGLLITGTIIFLCAAILHQLNLLNREAALSLYKVFREPRVEETSSEPPVIVADIGDVIQETVVPVVEASAVEETVSEGAFSYIEVIDGCEHDYSGECLRVRSGPGTEFPIINRLRSGMVLLVEERVEDSTGGGWYKVVFDEWLRYPERLQSDWYVSDAYVKQFHDEGTIVLDELAPTTSKRIIVDRSEQKLFAYAGEVLELEFPVSTGLEFTPTPRGEFVVFKKTPTRYMQGPLPYISSQDYYDLPGVPWNLYFTELGAVIHGAYWHDSFGSAYSHGCVNLIPNDAQTLYLWAPVGTKVLVRD